MKESVARMMAAWARGLLALAALIVLGSGNARAVITEIIDANGDGLGNTLSEPIGIAVDSAENVYLVGFSTDNAFKITPGGVISEIIKANGDGVGSASGSPLWNPNTIAVSSEGFAYVAGFSSHTVFKISPAGGITKIMDVTGDGDGNALDFPAAIAVNPRGNVYVTGSVSHNAFKITAGGVISEIIDATGDGAGNSLNLPFGIAVGGAGRVYITGQGSHNAFLLPHPPPAQIPALSHHGSWLALLLLFVGAGVAKLSRRHPRHAVR